MKAPPDPVLFVGGVERSGTTLPAARVLVFASAIWKLGSRISSA